MESALGGKPAIDYYLRYPIEKADRDIDTHGVSKKAAIEMMKCYKSGTLDPYVFRSFATNEDLWKIIEHYWNQEGN